MCGIAGIFHFAHSGPVDEGVLVAMTERLVHRGPDAKGVWLTDRRDVGLGSRRLSIRDVSVLGAQPMVGHTGHTALVYNGELYNCEELRDQLLADGNPCFGKSDTEVLLRGYETYGEAIINKIRGIFAFALWDGDRESLLLARDPIGVKPLYYTMLAGRLLFASEIKSIAAAPYWSPQVDLASLHEYLTFACAPGPGTLFRGVNKLPPATLLSVTRGGAARTREYWNPVTGGARLRERNRDMTEQDWIAETRRVVEASVSEQVVADVPIAVSLSGGVDSSSIAAIVSRRHGRGVDTFSIGFDEHQTAYNEFEHIDRINRQIGARTHILRVGHRDVVEFLQNFGEIADDPNADPVCCLAYFLSREMKQHGVSVALSGEGADEIFTGYRTYLDDLSFLEGPFRLLSRVPQRAWQALEEQTNRVANAAAVPTSIRAKLGMLARGQYPYWGNAVAHNAPELARLLDERSGDTWNVYRPVGSILSSLLDREPSAAAHQHLWYLELRMRLCEILLMRVDKMSMANSVEYRVPFLDPRLVELAWAMPKSIRYTRRHPKWVLKQAALEWIPPENVWRQKMGFAVPIREWLRDPQQSRPFVDLILQSKLLRDELVKADIVRDMIRENVAGQRDHHFRLWTILSLALCYDRWFA